MSGPTPPHSSTVPIQASNGFPSYTGIPRNEHADFLPTLEPPCQLRWSFVLFPLQLPKPANLLQPVPQMNTSYLFLRS